MLYLEGAGRELGASAPDVLEADTKHSQVHARYLEPSCMTGKIGCQLNMFSI